MNRYIKDYDPSSITNLLLLSHDWDVIELSFTVDEQKLLAWYNYVTETFKDLEFTFFDDRYVKPEYLPNSEGYYGYANKLYGHIGSWTLDWPCERDIPLPPGFAAKMELYPELLSGKPYKLQEKFKVGYLKELTDKLGESAFRFSRITKHETGSKLLGHIDRAYEAVRVHFPIISSEESTFSFGDNLDRHYSFKPGHVYLINASVWHATNNTGPTRAHIISDPSTDAILRLVNTKGAL